MGPNAGVFGRDMLQGASNTAASTVSAPVDLISWGLRKAGVPVPAAPVGGSDWMAQRGLTAQPESKIAGVLGELAGSVAPPVAIAKAPQIAAGMLHAGRNLAAPVALGPMQHQRGAISFAGQVNEASPAVNARELKSALLKRYRELSNEDPYRHYGVRVIGPDQQVQVGSKLTRSSKWVDGKPLSTKLPGTAVFELRPSYDNADRAIDRALSYNLGSKGQKIALVYGDRLGNNTMPEAFSALIKSPVIDSLFDRPEELAKVSRVEELRRILGQ